MRGVKNQSEVRSESLTQHLTRGGCQGTFTEQPVNPVLTTGSICSTNSIALISEASNDWFDGLPPAGAPRRPAHPGQGGDPAGDGQGLLLKQVGHLRCRAILCHNVHATAAKQEKSFAERTPLSHFSGLSDKQYPICSKSDQTSQFCCNLQPDLFFVCLTSKMYQTQLVAVAFCRFFIFYLFVLLLPPFYTSTSHNSLLSIYNFSNRWRRIAAIIDTSDDINSSSFSFLTLFIYLYHSVRVKDLHICSS